MFFLNIIFFLSGSVGISLFFQEKIFKFQNTLYLPLIYIFILNIIIFFSYLIAFYFFENILILKIIFYLICLFSLNTFFSLKKKKIDFIYNTEFIFLIIITIIIFLTLFLPPTGSDSLDYHLGVPKYWLENGGFSANPLWDTHYLSGSGEFLNFFGLYNGIANLNGIVQFSFLFLLFLSLSSKKNNLDLQNVIFFIVIFSNPLILPLIISQKPFLVPVLIFFTIFYCLNDLNLEKDAKINSIILILVISGLNFALSSKYNFIIPFLIFQFYLITNFKKKFLSILFINLIIFLIVSFPVYYKNYFFYSNPMAPFFENIFSSNYLTYEKIKFSNYLKEYHSHYNNLYEYLSNIFKIFIPSNLGSFFTTISPIIFLIFMAKLKKEDLNLITIFGIILLLNLLIGQHTARYYLIVFIPIMYLISQRFNFNLIFKSILFTFCLPQLFSIVFLLFNYYTVSEENFLSKFVNEYNQIKWIENNINEKYITDIRMNYYSNNKINISLLKWSEQYSSEITNIINKNNIKFAFVSDNEKYETVFSDHFLSCGDQIKEVNLPYATRNFFNEVPSYKMKLIKRNKKCLK